MEGSNSFFLKCQCLFIKTIPLEGRKPWYSKNTVLQEKAALTLPEMNSSIHPAFSHCPNRIWQERQTQKKSLIMFQKNSSNNQLNNRRNNLGHRRGWKCVLKVLRILYFSVWIHDLNLVV